MIAFAFDEYGKPKAPSPEEAAAADEHAAILAYTSGTLDNGVPFYAYVAVRPSRYKAFHADTGSGKPIKIGDYGTVVESGIATEPPPQVVAKMRDEYGFDEEFEDKLKKEVLKQQDIFAGGDEAKRIQDIVAMLKKKQGSGNAG